MVEGVETTVVVKVVLLLAGAQSFSALAIVPALTRV